MKLLKLRGELFLKEVKVSINAAETRRKVPLNSGSHWFLGSKSSRGEGQTAVGLRSEWEVSKC